MFPSYGAGLSMSEIKKVAASLEKIANATADSFDKINTEMKEIRQMTLQNWLALDYILASKGGVCALIGKECCTYIPDNSKEIQDLSKHIRKEAAKLHESDNWNLNSWFSSIFSSLGSTVIHSLLILVVVFTVVYLVFMIIQCYISHAAKPMKNRPSTRNEVYNLYVEIAESKGKRKTRSWKANGYNYLTCKKKK